MTTTVEDIVDFLQDEFFGETIRGGFLPTTPARVVAVKEDIGDEPPAETMVGRGNGPRGPNLESPNMMIMIRHEQDDYKSARGLAEQLYQFLHNQVGVIINDTEYKVIEAMQAPYNIGIDDRGLWIIGFSIRCIKRPNAL